MRMTSSVEWVLLLSCIACATSGVQRQAKVRSALHLQCRDGQLISVDAATLVSGDHAAPTHGDGLNGSRPSAAAGGGSTAEQRCQRAYGEQDDDFRTLVRRCSGLSSCVGIVSPNNLTMAPCGEQFGHSADDVLEVNYTCVDPSEVSDICDNVSRNLFRGYIRSPSYPASTTAKGSRLRCSCVLSAQNYASIELLLLDVAVDSPTVKLEVAPAGGRPVVRLCSADQVAEPSQQGTAAGCLNRRHSTSYSRLNVTFTLNPNPAATTDQLQDKNRFLLRYSARELGRVLSSCQLLEGSSSTVVVLPHGQDEEGSSTPLTTAGATAATSMASEDTLALQAVEVLPGEDGSSLVVVVSAVVPGLLLLAALIIVGARFAWIHQRKKHWRLRNRSILPCCCVASTTRISFAPFVSRAFDGVVYAMPAASKGNTLHAYDEAARASCPTDCDDDHYDSIPGHHQYQDVEYGCRHYETVPDSVDAGGPRRPCACDSSGATSDESTWSGEAAAAAPLVAQSSSSSSSSSSHSGASPPALAGSSQSTLYEVLGDGELATTGEPRLGGSCGSVHSLGIDFSDIVAESLKRMSAPLFHSVAAVVATASVGHDGSPASSLRVQCEDYLSPACVHAGTCCSAASRAAATVAARDDVVPETEPRP